MFAIANHIDSAIKKLSTTTTDVSSKLKAVKLSIPYQRLFKRDFQTTVSNTSEVTVAMAKNSNAVYQDKAVPTSGDSGLLIWGANENLLTVNGIGTIRVLVISSGNVELKVDGNVVGNFINGYIHNENIAAAGINFTQSFELNGIGSGRLTYYYTKS